MARTVNYPAAYARLERASRRSRRRTTDRGRLIMTGALICAALGIDTDLTLIYQLFALLICLIFVSRIALRLQRPHVSVRRRLPRYATVDEPFDYYIEVTNEGDRVERDLKLNDLPRVQQPTSEEFRARREPFEETRNAWDRFIGFHRFVWLQRLKTGIVTQVAEVPDISIKARVNVRVEATPLRRGIIQFQSTAIMHPDPLGMNYGLTRFETPEQMLVLPRRYPIGKTFEIPGGRHFQPGGNSATWSIGESDEFVALRDYRDGDSMRKIHWASTAKRKKPVVKEYQDEYFVRQVLALDTSTTNMAILDGAVSVAASFALKMSDSESMLDLVYLANGLEVITSGHSDNSINRQLEALACANPSTLPLDLVTEALLQRARQFSGCIVVLTGWDAPQQELVERVRASGLPLEIFLVADVEVAAPPYIRLLHPDRVGEGLGAL